MPISRLVAVSLRPASSVLSRTLARTGRVLRLETARLTTDRPRARFSCMTESLTWVHSNFEAAGSRAGGGLSDGRGDAPLAIDRRISRGSGGYLLSIFSLRHHRHHGVDGV